MPPRRERGRLRRPHRSERNLGDQRSCAVGTYGENVERNFGSRSKLGIPRDVSNLQSLCGIQSSRRCGKVSLGATRWLVLVAGSVCAC